MSTSDIIERNDNGKITHVKSSDGGFECWHEYNEKVMRFLIKLQMDMKSITLTTKKVS